MDRIIEIKVGGNYLSKDNKVAGVRGEGNVTNLRITFAEDWDNYAKKITFWNARGLNPVERILTTDLLENIEENTRIYIVPIPAEPMEETGMFTFVIEGYLDGKRQKCVPDKLEVKDAPIVAGEPIDPTPTQAEQLQVQIDGIKGTIQSSIEAEKVAVKAKEDAVKAKEDAVKAKEDAVEAKEDIQNMSVSAETLRTGEQAFAQKTEREGVVNLHFGLPAGGKGDRGISGVYVGSDTPSDPEYNVWIDPNGTVTDVAPQNDDHVVASSLMLNIRDFGAVGDGMTDDTEALKAAARCGQAVFFPAGIYILSEQITMTANISWFGEGTRSCIMLMPKDQSRPEQYNGKTVYNCYMIHHQASDIERYSISLQGLVLDANRFGYEYDMLGNGSSANDHTTCLDLNNPSSVYLDNVQILNGLIEGCYINVPTFATKITISNCLFGGNGVRQTDGSGLHIEGYCEYTLITNCEFSGNGFHGLVLGGAKGANVSNITCIYNGYAGVCLWGGASNNTLNGIYCKGNEYGLMLKSSFSSHYNDTEYDPSWMSFAANNVITGLVTEGHRFGIVFGNSERTIINGWNSVSDEYSYCVGCGTANKDVTGLVVGILNFETEEEWHDISSTEKFKVQFLGR